MGTRCLTVIKEGEKDSDNLLVIYRQFDGYLNGHGKMLKEVLNGYRIVNGIGEYQERIANGMDDLAAQLVYFLKNKQIQPSPLDGEGKYKRNKLVGNIYIAPSDTPLDEYYVYTLYSDPVVEPENNEGETAAEWRARMKEFQKGVKLNIHVKVGEKVVYDGCIDDFDPDMKMSDDEE